MSWYKKAKLIDKGYGTNLSPMSLLCMYCGRHATHPIDPTAMEEKRIWKKPEELDKEELIEATESYDKQRGSHGICSYCFEIINETGSDNPEKIKELSLQKS